MKTFLVTAFMVAMAKAWSINGHLLVAGIAERLLEENAPASLAAANSMLGALTAENSALTWQEDQHAFVECATFVNDVTGQGWQDQYHTINLPFYDESTTAGDFSWSLDNRTSIDGLQQLLAWLSGKQGTAYQDGFIYRQLMNKFRDDEAVAKSYALRMLIHIVGDIHQPFNCIDRYTLDFPTGDNGGELFPLNPKDGVDNLHQLWDTVLLEEINDISLPFTNNAWDSFQRGIDQIDRKNSSAVSPSTVFENTDFAAWANESFEIAMDAYSGVKEGGAVTRGYLRKKVSVAYDQINVAGHRLYYAINYIFS